jgi:predicted component of type VI protein secretion system
MSGERPLLLTLTVRGMAQLANGSPTSLTLDRRSATIGRATSADWALPDPELHISGRHCDILFRNGGYELVDNSTNGTFVNGAAERLSGPHRLQQGDVVRIGKYELGVALAPIRTGLTTPPQGSPPPQQAPAALPPGDDDIWNKFASSNAIDWDRGGFGGAVRPATPSPAPPPPPVAPTPMAMPAPAAAPPPPAATPIAAPAPVPAAGATGSADAALEAFLSGVGIERDAIRQDPAGVMLEARARAKSQMGAQGTGLEISGNNPLKFARNPDQALKHVLNPAERGFMDAERSVEDGWKDLQAHQLATLKAMQGALRSTLERFSPKSIRSRAETRGMLEKILPGARDAALWKAYEREFSGVAFDSDEAFMDTFAKEFRHAYDEITRGS